MLDDAEYREWIKAEAKFINSDGCSCVPDFAKDCCYEHDLAYFYGRDPRWAFALHSWALAPKISRFAADNRFFVCNPITLKHRWVGVRLGGWRGWRKHRKLRP